MAGNKQNKKSPGTAKYAFIVFWCTFFCACVISLVSQLVLEEMKSIIIGFVFLIAVIGVGILFDIVGTAVAVANKFPFNAKASRKIPGAKKALALTNNASKVANICNDVIGDVCGTVSGGIGAALIIILVESSSPWYVIVSVIMTGLIAAMTVSGKAIGKFFAINQADDIIWLVGQLLDLKAVFKYKKSQKKQTKK